MVVTRSARPQAGLQATSAESSQQKDSAKRIQAHPKGRKESPSDDPSTAESQTTKKQSPAPSARKRKSRTTGSLPELNKPTDGEISEAESTCSSVSEVQDPIFRITRRRQILVTGTPVSSVRKRPKVTPVNESHTEEEVSEAESHVSGISRIVPSTVIATQTRGSKAKSLTGPSQESYMEAVSDAESSCSEVSSFSGIATRRTTRSMQRRLQAQTEENDTMIVAGNEKQGVDTPENSKDSETRRTSCRLLARSLSQINKPNLYNNEIYNDLDEDPFFGNSGKTLIAQKHPSVNISEEEQDNVSPLKHITKRNCESSDEDAKEPIDEGKEINEKDSQLTLPELQDTSLQQLVSQRHSTPENNKTTSEPSNLNCEAVMKSLAHTFAVVEVDRCDEGRKSTIKTSDWTELGGGDEECTVTGDSQDMDEERDVDFECDAKLRNPELNASQDKDDSVLLVLSSDESQQSESSEDEEDTICFVENSGQKESLNGDSETTSHGSALFVIDTTPGLSADKNFYLNEEDKASEVVTEEEEEEEEDEEEEEESEEEPSDHDRNKDNEFCDEDNLLNSTKSKLLKLTSSSIDPGLSIKQLGGLYINFNADKLQLNKRTLTQLKEKKKNELLQKAVITPDFEKNYSVPPYRESKYKLQKKRRCLRLILLNPHGDEALPEASESLLFRTQSESGGRMAHVFVYGTLKTGQPNHRVLLDGAHGRATLRGRARTLEPYPLVIAGEHNIPWLLQLPGHGRCVAGEVYAVDEQMLRFLDEFEGCPDMYQRTRLTVAVEGPAGGTVQCFAYSTATYPPEWLQLPHLDDYDSQGEHGLRYNPRENR